MGAKGGEELRMAEGQMQGAVSTHRNSGYAARGAPGLGAIAFFNLRQKFSEKEILITTLAVAGIYVEAGTPIRCDDEQITELMALPKVLDKIETAGMDEHLLVVTEAVKKIEDGIPTRLSRFVAGWQEYAVSDGMTQYFARRGKTFSPASRENGSDCSQIFPGPRKVAKNRPSPPNSAVLIPPTN